MDYEPTDRRNDKVKLIATLFSAAALAYTAALVAWLWI
jgi:hypothetical protein